jgi:hypothetical protein
MASDERARGKSLHAMAKLRMDLTGGNRVNGAKKFLDLGYLSYLL